MSQLNVKAFYQFRLAFEILLQRVAMDDSERLKIVDIHSAWEQKAYGSSEYVRYGENAQGKQGLWMSDRNVPANAPPPGQPTNPTNWKFVGWSTS